MIKLRFNKAIFITTILLTINFMFISQNTEINAQSFFFSNLGIEDGLPSNVTNSIVQDDYGFIWIGTQEGLCRYDGYKMMLFKSMLDPASLPSNSISTLLKDEHLIWVGTWDGLCTINTQSFEIERINIGSSHVIRALFKDAEGKIWIGTSKGLIIYDKKLGKYQFYDVSNSDISHNTIRTIYQASNGDMWIGTYDRINLFRAGKFKSFDLKRQYKPWLKNNLICSIQAYSENNDSLLWIGTETGLCLFNTVEGKTVNYNSSNSSLSNEVIKCIYKQNDSILWLGTDFGLNIMNTHTQKIETYYHDPLLNTSISNNVIWEIFEDNKGRIWFITSNGVSLLDNHQNLYSFNEEYFSLSYPKIGNQIRDILVGMDGKIWLASIYGVTCHDTKKGLTVKYMADNELGNKLLLNNVFSLEEDNQGRIWIGTAGGINIWDEKLNKMYAISANKLNGLTSNYINSFAKEADGSIWVSVWEGGLFKVTEGMDNPEKMKFMLVDNNGDGTVINAGNQIFYGSHKELSVINQKTFEKKPVEIVNKALNDKEISSIIGNENGDVWIGAENLLLKYSYQTNRVKRIDINTGFPKKLIALEKDKDGNIWASTNNSILKIEAKGDGYFTIPINPNSPLKSFYYHCSAMDLNGNILFGGDNGYIEINPKTILLPKEAPVIYLTSLFINNQLITPLDSMKLINKDIAYCNSLLLKHNQNSFSVEFSSLDYLFPEVGQYAYRLKEHDNKWRYTSGKKNFAVYSNLLPGEYIFELKGTDHFGIWSKPISLPITISRPFWLNNVFILIYIILFFFLTYLVYRLLKYRQKLNQELKMAKLEKQHAEELFKTKQQFFTNISHEFRTPLSLILPTIQQVLKSDITHIKNRKLLKLADRNAQRLNKLVNQLLDFGKMESSKLSLKMTKIELVSYCKYVFSSFKDMARRHEIDYQFKSELHNCYIEIDTEKFEAILFNLLSNAFKYTPYNGSIHLNINPLNKTNSKTYVTVEVKDSGIGIPENELEHIFERFYQTAESKALNLGSGIGLTLAQEYAKLHNGSISVKSQQNSGSIFTIHLPMISDVNQNESIVNIIASEEEPQLMIPNQQLDENARQLLIIDDNEDILDYIEMNLANQYHIYRATNGKEGLEMTLKIRPHLIISDIMMPVMDGISLCAKVKENQSIAHIPVILLTAKTLDLHKTEGMETGADLYITKPFNIDYLKSCIESIFRREELFTNYIQKELLLKPQPENQLAKNQDEIFLRKVVTMIEKNASDPDFSVEMISESLGLSSTHLYRRLKAITNQSTSDIIKNYRMQKAAQMIANNEGNITEIMYAVGFSSLSSFSKSFKSVFQVSPSMYFATINNQKK